MQVIDASFKYLKDKLVIQFKQDSMGFENFNDVTSKFKDESIVVTKTFGS